MYSIFSWSCPAPSPACSPPPRSGAPPAYTKMTVYTYIYIYIYIIIVTPPRSGTAPGMNSNNMHTQVENERTHSRDANGGRQLRRTVACARVSAEHRDAEEEASHVWRM